MYLNKVKRSLQNLKMSRRSNNAVIYRKFQPYGPIEDGETLVFEKRPYDLPEPRDGDIIVQTMYCALDVWLVNSLLTCLISAVSHSRSCPSIIHSGSSQASCDRLTEGIWARETNRRLYHRPSCRFEESFLPGGTSCVGHLLVCRIQLYPCQPNPSSLSPYCSRKQIESPLVCVPWSPRTGRIHGIHVLPPQNRLILVVSMKLPSSNREKWLWYRQLSELSVKSYAKLPS